MSKITITVSMSEHDFEYGIDKYVVHTPKNKIFDENYDRFCSISAAKASAIDCKGELEAAGYSVSIVLRSLKQKKIARRESASCIGRGTAAALSV